MHGDAIYISRQDLLGLHEAVIHRHGGMPGVRDDGILDSCLAQPGITVFNVERYPTVHAKAAAYCYFIVRNHPFFDGNKRTGFVAILEFLRLNDMKADFDENEAYGVILGVAKGETHLDAVASMIASAVRRANPPPD